ncbi:MAG: hypothetical protein ABFS18_05405 [Thermodesulfobacteriota bacterium]
MSTKKTAKEQNDIFEKYKRLQIHEKQYNTQLIELRKLGSAWLLAAFAGIGFMLKGVNAQVIDPLMGIVMVSFLGAIGLFVLWLLDRHVYFKLLNSTIYQAIKMEFENKDHLPQIRTTNLATCGNLSILVEAFYSIPICILLAITATFLTFFAGTIPDNFAWYLIPATTVVMIIVFIVSVFMFQPIEFSVFAAKTGEDQKFINFLQERKRAYP